MKKLLAAVLLVAFVAWYWSDTTEIIHGPGEVAPETLDQYSLDDKQSISYGDYRITPLAGFSGRARVLGKKRYWMGRESDLSPVDLALGWGPMSDEKYLKDINISQSNRFYYWQVENFPIPRSVIERHSANMHFIPANDYIRDLLLDVNPGEVVNFKGFLVRVDAQDNWHWKSSLTRKDTGNGACELIYVDQLFIETVVTN